MKKEQSNVTKFKKPGKKDSLFEEFNRKRANHQMSKLMWILTGAAGVLILAAVIFVVVRVFFLNKEYTKVTEVGSTEFFISTGSDVYRFGNNFIVCNSDGVKCVNYKGEQIWNEAFSMQKPLIDITEGMVAVADYNGSSIYMMDEKNVLGRIDTGMPIRKFKAAGSGYVMAVLDNTDNTPIYVYNTAGEEMLYFNTTMKGYGYPLEIAISDNGILGAVSYLNVDKGSFYSSLGFYNFGEVGQNYQDSLMSSYKYQNALVPEVEFAGNNKAVAVADNRIMFFSGDQMPQSNGEILITEEKILSVYEDKNYVALFYESEDSAYNFRADIYDYDARLRDKVYFDIEHTNVFFDNNRIVLYNNEEVLIHVIGGRDKFIGTLEDGILALIPTSSPKRFIQVTPNRIKTLEFD
ncbi:MAG: DUF5711 family protein [Lachnospiraceae bacterium]|nr:DUF5711 family protein [Lachnospiraceae bacterium]